MRDNKNEMDELDPPDGWTKTTFYAELFIGLITYFPATALAVDDISGASQTILGFCSPYGLGAGIIVTALASWGSGVGNRQVGQHGQSDQLYATDTEEKPSATNYQALPQNEEAPDLMTPEDIYGEINEPAEEKKILSEEITPKTSNDIRIQIEEFSDGQASFTEEEQATALLAPNPQDMSKKIEESKLTPFQKIIPFLDSPAHIFDNFAPPLLFYQTIKSTLTSFNILLPRWADYLITGASLAFGGFTFWSNGRSCRNHIRKYNEIQKQRELNPKAYPHQRLDALIVITAITELLSGYANYFYAPAQAFDFIMGFEEFAIGLSLGGIIFGSVTSVATFGTVLANIYVNIVNNTKSNAPLTKIQKAATVGSFLAAMLDNSGTPILVLYNITRDRASRAAKIACNVAALFGGAAGALSTTRTYVNSFKLQNEQELAIAPASP